MIGTKTAKIKEKFSIFILGKGKNTVMKFDFNVVFQSDMSKKKLLHDIFEK